MQIKRNGSTLSILLSPAFESYIERILTFLKRSSDYLVLILAASISFLAWSYYFNHNLVLSYNDSMSHLDIARRVVDGLKPGIAQIGSVWLPLPHLLMLPFIWNNFLWHSGLAGSIISILAFVGSTYFIYKFVELLAKDKVAAILAGLIFMVNPNMTYMQSVPMTESLLLFFFVASSFFILKWQKTDNYKYLVLAGFFTLSSTLTRYDGWMLLAQVFFVILIISLNKGGYKKMEGNIILFMTIALYGVILWLIWNKLIFGDALYFLNGPFSAKAQQLVFEGEGRLFSKGNLLYSTYIYVIAVLRNNGALLSVLGLIGFAAYYLKNKLNNEALAISLLLSPFFFNVAALFLGHSIINLPDIPPYALFNVRYGLMMLPTIAIFVAYLSRKLRMIQLLILIILVIQTAFMYKEGEIITVKDGISGASAQGMSTTGKWLGENAKSGLILVAASSQDSLIFQSGLPMDRFIHEGTGDYWKESLENPTLHAEFIAMHHGDLVYRKICENPVFLNNYEKVYDGDFTDIFKLKINTVKPLTAADLP